MLRENQVVFREPHPTKKVGSSSLADYQLHRKTRFPEQLLPRRQAPCPCPSVEFLGDRLKPFPKQSRGLPFFVSSNRQLIEFSDIAIPANHVASGLLVAGDDGLQYGRFEPAAFLFKVG